MELSLTKKTTYLPLFIIILHIVGIGGLYFSPFQDFFALLTPFHLLSITALTLIAHTGAIRPLVLFVMLCFLVGFIVEVIGVNTGFPFGDYRYGRPLGLQLWGTPIMIGVNWLLMTYLCAWLVSRIKMSVVVQVLLSATLLTVSDILIEPTAISLDFWSWDQQVPPIQNYLGWWVTGLMTSSLFFICKLNKENYVVPYTYASLLIFFVLGYFCL